MDLCAISPDEKKKLNKKYCVSEMKTESVS